MPEEMSTWATARQTLRREAMLGGIVTLGGTPYGQMEGGGTRVGFMGRGIGVNSSGIVGQTGENVDAFAPGGKMGAGFAAFAAGTTVLSMGMGFSQHGLMGAAGMLGTDIAISAASTRALPRIKTASGATRLATGMLTQAGSYVGAGLGSMVGGAIGSIAGAPGMYAGQMAGAYAGGAMQAAGVRFLEDAAQTSYRGAAGRSLAGAGRSAVSAMGSGLRIAGRHPLAAFAVAGSAVALTAGYATYKSAQFGMAGLVAGARTRRDKQMINTAGDLAAFNTRRSATAAQMAHRHRASLGMQLNEAYSMTATRYHHSQRVFK